MVGVVRVGCKGWCVKVVWIIGVDFMGDLGDF